MNLLDIATNVVGGEIAVLLSLGIISISVYLIYKTLCPAILTKKLSLNIIIAIFFAINIIGLNLLMGKVFFPNGKYFNYGIIGVYIWGGLSLIPLVISVIIMFFINQIVGRD